MNKLLKNIASLGIVQMVNYVFPLISIPYISRIIGPEGYGIINYSTSFIAYFTLLTAYGFDLTATRKIAQNKSDLVLRSRVFSEVINARILLLIISTLLFIICLIYIEPLKRDIYVSIILFFTCISTVITPQYIYQGLQELSVFAKVNFVKGLLSTILLFVFIQKPTDYYWVPAINVILGLLLSIYLLLNACKKFDLKFKWVSFSSTLKLLQDEKLIFISTVLISLYTTTNTVILGFFDNIQNIGYFTTSQSFINIVNSVVTVPLATALYPFVGSAFSKSRVNGIQTVRQIIPIIIIVVSIGCLLLLILAPFIIKILYGNKFDHSVLPTRIMAFLPLLISVSNIFGIQVMINLNMDKLFLKVIGICSIIGIIGAIFMCKMWGFIGTAYNIMIVETIVTVTMYFVLKKKGIDLIDLRFFKFRAIISFLKNNLMYKK